MNTKENVLPDCDKPYHKNKRKVQKEEEIKVLQKLYIVKSSRTTSYPVARDEGVDLFDCDDARHELTQPTRVDEVVVLQLERGVVVVEQHARLVQKPHRLVHERFEVLHFTFI